MIFEKQNSETAISILATIIAHASAIGIGLSRKKIKKTNIRIIILAEILKLNKIKRPYWFIFYHLFIKRFKLQKSFVLEKLGKSLNAKHFELEALCSVYYGVKSQAGHYQAVAVCTQIAKNLKRIKTK